MFVFPFILQSTIYFSIKASYGKIPALRLYCIPEAFVVDFHIYRKHTRPCMYTPDGVKYAGMFCCRWSLSADRVKMHITVDSLKA